jgi:predicted nucleotidyltransferase
MHVDVREICDKLVEVLKREFGRDFKSLALFGSAAREEETEESDIDFFAIIENLPKSHFQRSLLFNRLSALNFRRHVLIIAKTPAEFESNFSSLYLDLAVDGEIIYDTDDFLKESFKKIRKIIDRAGLERKRNNGNFFWAWKKPPRHGWELSWEGYRELSR